MMRPRNRLISFRVSEQEYEDLRFASEARGARSVSEFVRCGVNWIVANCERRIVDLFFPTNQPVPPLPSGPAPGTRTWQAANSTGEPDSVAAVRQLSGRIESLLARMEHRKPTDDRKNTVHRVGGEQRPPTAQ